MKRVKRTTLVVAGGAAALYLLAQFASQPELFWMAPAVVGHEAMHAITARLVGMDVARFGLGMGPVVRHLGRIGGTEIVLSKWPIGAYVGLTRSSHERAGALRQIVVALSGVAFNLLFGAALWVAGLYLAAVCSVLLALFNLAPVLPLDGGMALHHALSPRGQRALERHARAMMVALCVLTGLIFLTLYIALLTVGI
jgi:membrane-associated protease RseP (regulator of RpoE activity)